VIEFDRKVCFFKTNCMRKLDSKELKRTARLIKTVIRKGIQSVSSLESFLDELTTQFHAQEIRIRELTLENKILKKSAGIEEGASVVQTTYVFPRIDVSDSVWLHMDLEMMLPLEQHLSASQIRTRNKILVHLRNERRWLRDDTIDSTKCRTIEDALLLFYPRAQRVKSQRVWEMIMYQRHIGVITGTMLYRSIENLGLIDSEGFMIDPRKRTSQSRTSS